MNLTTAILFCLVLFGLAGAFLLLRTDEEETIEVGEATCTHASIEVLAEVAPTCTEVGKTESRKCKSCGKVFAKAQTIQPLGHDFPEEFVVDVAATCETSGKQSHHCLRCGVKSSVETIPALGHDVETIGETVAATCTDTGTNAGEKCTRCQKIVKEIETVPALGHSYGAFTTVSNPTCTKQGERTHTCANCNYVESIAITPLGHTFDKYSLCTRDNCTACDSHGVCYGEDLVLGAYAYAGSNFDLVEAYISPTYCGKPVKVVKNFSATSDLLSPSRIAETLKIVHIPSSVEEIADNAFKGCSNLTTVEIADGVKRIGHYAFSGTSLNSLFIPASVESIGQFICSGLVKEPSSDLLVGEKERIIEIKFACSFEDIPTIESLTTTELVLGGGEKTVVYSDCSFVSTPAYTNSFDGLSVPATYHTMSFDQSRPTISMSST